jgi:hypothetical protein
MISLISMEKKSWKSLSKQEQKEFDLFIVNKMLATNSEYIELVNLMQLNYNIPKEHSYTMLLRLLPKKKIYIDFIRIKNDKINKDLLQILSKHYETSISEAKTKYLAEGKDVISNLLTRLGYEDKQIIKLLK